MGRAHAPAEKKAMDRYTATSDRAAPTSEKWEGRRGKVAREVRRVGEVRQGSARGKGSRVEGREDSMGMTQGMKSGQARINHRKMGKLEDQNERQKIDEISTCPCT